MLLIVFVAFNGHEDFKYAVFDIVCGVCQATVVATVSGSGSGYGLGVDFTTDHAGVVVRFLVGFFFLVVLGLGVAVVALLLAFEAE